MSLGRELVVSSFCLSYELIGESKVRRGKIKKSGENPCLIHYLNPLQLVVIVWGWESVGWGGVDVVVVNCC